MVLTLGIRVRQYPTNARVLSSKISALRFSLTEVVGSLPRVACFYGWSSCVKLHFTQVSGLSMFGNRKSLAIMENICAFNREGTVGPRIWSLNSLIAVVIAEMFVGRRMDWSLKSSADGRGLDPLTGSGDGRTRLLKALQSLQMRFNARIQELRKDLPRKLLFFLVGFYCATAFATVIGQTGDWDILSAGVAVAVVEGIGALMYKVSPPLPDRTRSVIIMFNYWKAGLTLGLFLDSFKY